MSGLQLICKLYGGMTINGVRWVWDYANDKPIRESEMTAEQRSASERAKWLGKSAHPPSHIGGER